MTRSMTSSAPEKPAVEGSKALLALAFAGIALILMIVLVVALYTQNRLSTAVQRTTAEALPELLAALRLSERNALLAATTPTLSTARNHRKLEETRIRLDGLLADVVRQLGLLGDQGTENTSKEVHEAVETMRNTLGELKAASDQRIDLAARQADALMRIQKVHSELIDTVSPVVYGVSSLNNLFARRAQRKRNASVRELRDVLHPRLLALLELKFLTSGAFETNEVSGAIEDRLAFLRGILSKEDFASLSSASESLLSSQAPFSARVYAYRGLLLPQIDKAIERTGRRTKPDH